MFAGLHGHCMNTFILIRLDGIRSQPEQLYLRIVKFLFLTGLEQKDRYDVKNQLFENIVFPQKKCPGTKI